MDYEQAIETMVTRKQARQEIERHYQSFDEFMAECGDRQEYSGKVVLDWLGY